MAASERIDDYRHPKIAHCNRSHVIFEVDSHWRSTRRLFKESENPGAPLYTPGGRLHVSSKLKPE